MKPMKLMIALVLILLGLATKYYKMISAQADSETSQINADTARSKNEEAQVSEQLAKCRLLEEPLVDEANLWNKKIQGLKTKNSENRLDLEKCKNAKDQCEKDLAKCEYKLSDSTREGCREYAEIASGTYNKYDLLAKEFRVSGNVECNSYLKMLKMEIEDLKKIYEELQIEIKQEEVKECKKTLSDCKENFHKCERDLIDIGCSR